MKYHSYRSHHTHGKKPKQTLHKNMRHYILATPLERQSTTRDQGPYNNVSATWNEGHRLGFGPNPPASHGQAPFFTTQLRAVFESTTENLDGVGGDPPKGTHLNDAVKFANDYAS